MPSISVELISKWVSLYQDFLPQARAGFANGDAEKTEFGVEASTMRAISNGSRGANGPLQSFNTWAGRMVYNIRKAAACDYPRHQAGFESLHLELSMSLQAHWRLQSPDKPLSLAHCYKMVDLFVRWMSLKGWQPVKEHGPALRDALLSYGHIPLDRKSLHILSETFGGIGLAGPFSMGDVHTQAAYDFYQSLARGIVEEAGGSPLLFDAFCWHSPDCQAVYND
jgi:hypothetical protein